MDEAPHITVEYCDGPLPAMGCGLAQGVGAWVCFEGIVRPEEHGRRLIALRYTAYQPMASEQMRLLAESAASDHGLLAVRVQHSTGEVPVGSCSFRLAIGSEHRKEALHAMDAFIDAMKREVPIWKLPVYADRSNEPERAV